FAYNTDQNIGEMVKEPATYLRVEMRTQGGNTFAVTEQVNGMQHDVSGNNYTTLEQATGLVDSAATRTPIIMTISATHFSLSCNGFTFYNASLPMAFPTTQTVFQVQHVSYDPEKEGGRGDTWHWSNLAISSAVPYYLNQAAPEAVGDYNWLGNKVTFAPAPAGAFLRFQGFNAHYDSFPSGYDISFDGGATWAPWKRVSNPGDNSLTSVWQPVPQGATSAILRGRDGWYARDFYVMAANGAAPAPTVPAMPSPTAVARPTPVAINGVPCTVTLNGIAQRGTCSGTFTPSH
ncbi:MAG TPA: hypothetical protein VGR57_19935, partial [Ktedonobacterales bacterium]|nr:hypothetical protein [Ktedonobacterales bacterium]